MFKIIRSLKGIVFDSLSGELLVLKKEIVVAYKTSSIGFWTWNKRPFPVQYLHFLHFGQNCMQTKTPSFMETTQVNKKIDKKLS